MRAAARTGLFSLTHSTGVIPANCSNCGRSLQGPYCAACGQKAAPLNPTVREFLHDLSHELLHFDGKIIQSVRLLLTRPGFLTREQFEGHRVRYVSPIRLYLVFSVLYFAVAAIAAPGNAVRITATPEPGEDPTQVEIRRQKIEVAANEALIHRAPRAMFLLVPVFAALVAATTRSSGRNYPQHLYFSLHLHAAWFCAAAIVAAVRWTGVGWLSATVSAVASLYGAAYFVLALRRAHGTTAVSATLRAAAIFAAYVFLVLAVLVASVFPVIFGG